MYLGLDGTGVPVRPTEVEGRRGKQPDGSAKTREVKLVTVWTAETRDKEGRPVRDPGSVSYNAAVESAASRDTDPLPFVGPLELGYSYRQLALIERLSSAEAARKALGRALRRLIDCMSNA